ncbi:Zn-ribbon domain-containing protein [Archaeoglobus veneficus]|uniref:Zn-ribbon containing protein n=1 Tax=Archaeoglobus veneficus (strain DSM 11195 / SNP6) TaxID=693661 RepID=F2KNP4_ARCVS|nr:Zn-ribbon domain-containing protein [Archaeoglobus veneficus]AEA46272.1 Protein of unknown function DUF2072, Zinc-ribbon [Archaeoglobus veneficus SNP6]
MPHRCTKCGKEYPDGDMRILQGCECGNNKFLYVPKEERGREKEVSEEEVREALPEGIESVKIISPGMYEINLEKVFSRDEIVIALQEDGRYVIHLPSLLKRRKDKQ